MCDTSSSRSAYNSNQSVVEKLLFVTSAHIYVKSSFLVKFLDLTHLLLEELLCCMDVVEMVVK